VFLILTLYFVLTEFNDLIELIGFIIIFAYLIFFHELEEYKVVETKYDLNEFLDGLRNTDTKKSL